jgi:UDP-galactopyranose mutase
MVKANYDILNSHFSHQDAPDIVCFCHLKWDFVFQRPQHLMVRWAKKRRVFFIEEPQIHDGKTQLNIRECTSGVHFVTPSFNSSFNRKKINRQMKEWINHLIEKFNINAYVSWYYTPMALDFTKHLSPLAIIYDCMDELSHFKNPHPHLKANEKKLLKKADVVFTGGHTLYEYKRKFHPAVYPFPSSVDVSHFSKARDIVQEPKDQANIPHPRLGFFGVIDERFDLELIKGLTQRRPDWHIVLIGPIAKIDSKDLPRSKNIHYLGQKKYEELPLYLGGWDIALLPFARNDSTRYISPTKTPEYLSGGKPVVSTSIQDVVKPYGMLNLVKIADSLDDFEKAVDDYLKGLPIDWNKKVNDYLQQLSWDKTWLQMKIITDKIIESKTPPGPCQEFNKILGTDADLSRKIATLNPIRDHYDYIVVGAGFAGSVVAERLALAGKKVLICDTRPHIGGNAFDHYNEEGILIHKYGPHIFHTNSVDVFNYLSQFTAWRSYQHRVLACVDQKLLPIPINLDTINKLYGWNLNSEELEEFFKRVAEPRAQIRTSEDVIISKVGKELYEKFFKHYTFKQWGLDPSQLDATVIARIPVRTNHDDRYFTDKYQYMPAQGFTVMFKNMLSSPNITIQTSIDYKKLIKKVSYKELVYSGPIDHFFDYCYGKLPYRSLEFKFVTHETEIYQAGPVINYPNQYDYTRVSEFKYLTGQKHTKTTVVYEFPKSEGDPYYPIPCPENNQIYQKYHELAEKTPGVHFVGRLGTYKYYNMDQVIAQALTLAAKLSQTHPRSGLKNSLPVS